MLHNRTLLSFTLAALLMSGCGSSDSVSVNPGTSLPLGPVGPNILRVIDSDGVETIDGQKVSQMCATGYDAQGQQVFGPAELPYGTSMTFTDIPDSVAKVNLDFHRAQGATLGTQTEPVNFATDDDNVIEVNRIAPASSNFSQRKTFTVRVENASDYPADQVFVSVNGKNRDKTAFYYVKFGANDQNTAERFGPVADWDKYSAPLSSLKKEGTNAYSFQCPYEALVSGRIYLSFGQKLQGIGLNNLADPLSLQLPSPTGAPDYLTLFEFMELSATIPDDQNAPQIYTLFANTSVVDFFSMGLGMTLNSTKGAENVGFVDDARTKVLAEFESPTTPSEFRTGRAYVKKGDKILRVLSPVKIVDLDPTGTLASYLNSAIDEGWARYAQTVLNILDNLGGRTYGFTYSGQLITNNNLPETCTKAPAGTTGQGETSTLPKPTTKIIFFCDDGAPPPNSWNNGGTDAHKRLCSLLSAALNRGVFSDYSTWGTASGFYTRADKKYNYYSKIMHQFAKDGKVYGFGYDDVYGQDPTLAEPLSEVNQVVIHVPKVPVL